MAELCRDKSSRLSALPREVISYIMNVCSWDDWGEELENKGEESDEDEDLDHFETLRRRQPGTYSIGQAQLIQLLMDNYHGILVEGDDDDDDDEYVPDDDDVSSSEMEDEE
jgi:hypothetical protein